MSRWLLSLLCILALLPASAAELTRKQLTDEYVAAVHAAYPTATVTVVAPLQVKVKGAAGGEGTAFLDNLYAEISRNPSRKQDLLQRHVASIAQIMKSDAERESVASESIVPLVKDRGWLKDMRSAGTGGKPLEFVYEPLNEDLLVVYGEDTPSSIQYFVSSVFEKTGIDRKDLRALAVKNLHRILDGVDLIRIEGVNSLTTGGDFDASLLLIDEVWNKENLQVKGEIVVAIPARNMLLFADSADAQAVDALARLAKRVESEDSYSLTAQLFVRRDGTFQRYVSK